MQTPAEAHQKVVDIWGQYYPTLPAPAQLEEFLQQSKILDHSDLNNLRTVIFAYHDFSIHHINTSTARYFGSVPEEILEVGPTYIIGCLLPQQVEAAVNNTRIISRQLHRASPEEKRRYQSTYVNCNITCRYGNKHRSMFHSIPVLWDEHNNPLLGMFLIHDLEPFLIDGTWWYRYQIGDRIFTYHSAHPELQETDILTSRELEILKLIAEGASSKEIAASLFLSVNTVDNHRRNMLKKTGAVDTSALIHVCKLCHMIQ